VRIAIVSNWYFPFYGGGQTAIRGIHGHMLDKHEVTVLTPLRDESPRVETMDGIIVRRFTNLHEPNQKPYVGSYTFCPGMFWHLLRNKYDIIHCYPQVNPNNNLALYAHFIKRTPIYLTIFDFINYSYYKLDHFPAANLLDYFVRSKPLLRRLAFRWRMGHFNAVFSIAPTEREFISHFNPRAKLMPLGVPLEEYDSAERGAFRKKHGLGNRPIVLTSGRVTPHKGQDVAVEIAARVVRQYPQVMFVMVGAIDDHAYYAKMTKRVSELGLDNNVLFTEAISRAEMSQAYVDSDLNLVPVRFMNFGLVILEGWAARKPLVQSDRTDPNLVQEGVDGLTFPFDDIDAGADTVCRLLADEKLRISMGEAGRKRVEENYTWKKVAEFVESTYAETMAKP
jgi:glycosyltransferase involved in cell wall biosynthesis